MYVAFIPASLLFYFNSTTLTRTSVRALAYVAKNAAIVSKSWIENGLRGNSFYTVWIIFFRDFLEGTEDSVERPEDSNKVPQELKQNFYSLRQIYWSQLFMIRIRDSSTNGKK
jgi:hypothetical protein